MIGMPLEVADFTWRDGHHRARQLLPRYFTQQINLILLPAHIRGNQAYEQRLRIESRHGSVAESER